MKKILSLILTVCICICGMSAPVFAQTDELQEDTPEELKQLYAQSAVLMDADSGRILFEKNGYEQMPMASTTKIMTCILALEIGNLDSEVLISKNAAAQPKVHLGMHEGQTFTLRDLLYSLMLESHNDSAVAIAEHISGSVEAFADLMNRKAVSIGLRQSHFVTPNGLDAEDAGGEHSTTAADLAAIMKYCIHDSREKEMFLEITGTLEYSFSDMGETCQYVCNNHNAFLGMMDGAISGKTGFTSKAGYCYVGALEQDDRCFIVALLACGWPNHKNYKWSDTRTLMNYGLEHYHYQNIWQEFETTEMSVENGVIEGIGLFDDASVQIEAKTELEEFQMLLCENEAADVEITMEQNLTAPIRKGAKVGTIRYALNGKTLMTIPIVVKKNVYSRDFSWVLTKILERMMLKNIN